MTNRSNDYGDPETLFTEIDFPPGVTDSPQPLDLSTTAKQIVTDAIAHGQNLELVMPRRFKGHLAREIGELHKEGVDPELILAAAIYVIEQGLDPSVLASSVVTVQRNPAKAGKREDRELIDEFLAKTGVRWPTGSRWVHSRTAGTYIHDPLGTERPDYEVPWGPPSRDELLAALKEKKARENAEPDGEGLV